MNPYLIFCACATAYFVFFFYNYFTKEVILPTFTASAYQPNGFYAYYHGNCKQDNHCLTVPVTEVSYNNTIKYSESYNAWLLSTVMGFRTVQDQDYNSTMLFVGNQTIFVLHNEYVTQKEFDFINSSKHVVYLYPNALYGKVDYIPQNCDLWSMDDCQLADSNPMTQMGFEPKTIQPTITLIKGHGYMNVSNGFGWKYDNTSMEKTQCGGSIHYRPVANGIQATCWMQNPIGIFWSLLKLEFY